MASKTKAHQRYRTEDGTIVPGVTTVIDNLGWNKRALMGWMRKECLAGRDPYKVRDAAADIGTVAHALVEEHIHEALGDPDYEAVDRLEYAPKTFDKAENAFIGFLDWEQDHGVEYHAAELQLVSEEYRYGGTLDIVATVDGRKSLVDLKTSKGVYEDHTIQIAAYRWLYREVYGEWLRPMILRIGKTDGAFDPHPVAPSTAASAFEVFKRLRHIHDQKGELRV